MKKWAGLDILQYSLIIPIHVVCVEVFSMNVKSSVAIGFVPHARPLKSGYISRQSAVNMKKER